jgi:hypothetical protein
MLVSRLLVAAFVAGNALSASARDFGQYSNSPSNYASGSIVSKIRKLARVVAAKRTVPVRKRALVGENWKRRLLTAHGLPFHQKASWLIRAIRPANLSYAPTRMRRGIVGRFRASYPVLMAERVSDSAVLRPARERS